MGNGKSFAGIRSGDFRIMFFPNRDDREKVTIKFQYGHDEFTTETDIQSMFRSFRELLLIDTLKTNI